MSVVKQKLNNVSLTQKCKIIRLIEKEITDNSAFEKLEFQETLFRHRWKTKKNFYKT